MPLSIQYTGFNGASKWRQLRHIISRNTCAQFKRVTRDLLDFIHDLVNKHIRQTFHDRAKYLKTYAFIQMTLHNAGSIRRRGMKRRCRCTLKSHACSFSALMRVVRSIPCGSCRQHGILLIKFIRDVFSLWYGSTQAIDWVNLRAVTLDLIVPTLL